MFWSWKLWLVPQSYFIVFFSVGAASDLRNYSASILLCYCQNIQLACSRINSSVLLLETLSCKDMYSNRRILFMKNVLFGYEINWTLCIIKCIMQHVLKMQWSIVWPKCLQWVVTGAVQGVWKVNWAVTFMNWSNFEASAVMEFEDLSLFFTVLNCFPSCVCKQSTVCEMFSVLHQYIAPM
jgi:hypothetical protein